MKDINVTISINNPGASAIIALATMATGLIIYLSEKNKLPSIVYNEETKKSELFFGSKTLLPVS